MGDLCSFFLVHVTEMWCFTGQIGLAWRCGRQQVSRENISQSGRKEYTVSVQISKFKWNDLPKKKEERKKKVVHVI